MRVAILCTLVVLAISCRRTPARTVAPQQPSGNFASTTETADWLLDRFGMARTPVLEWGPMGSQVLSRSVLGGFEVIGVAGNTAPDHVDHFHGMAPFVARLLSRP